MNPQRHEHLDLDREQETTTETTRRILLEIEEDARRLKSRYPKETVVTGGGE